MEKDLNTISVDASILGFRQPKKIVPTIANVKNALKMNINVNEKMNFTEKDDFSLLDWFKAQLDVENMTTEYVSDILELNDAQKDRLENTNAEDIYGLYLQITSKMLGLDAGNDTTEDATPSESGEVSK